MMSKTRKKSDKGPSEYLPSDKKLACAYIKKSNNKN